MLPKDEPDDKLTSLPSRMSGIKLFSSSPSAKKKVKSEVGLLEDALMAVCIVMCNAYSCFQEPLKKVRQSIKFSGKNVVKVRSQLSRVTITPVL